VTTTLYETDRSTEIVIFFVALFATILQIFVEAKERTIAAYEEKEEKVQHHFGTNRPQDDRESLL